MYFLNIPEQGRLVGQFLGSQESFLFHSLAFTSPLTTPLFWESLTDDLISPQCDASKWLAVPSTPAPLNRRCQPAPEMEELEFTHPPPSGNTIITSRQSFECNIFLGGCWWIRKKSTMMGFFGGISCHDFRWFHALYPKQCGSLCKSWEGMEGKHHIHLCHYLLVSRVTPNTKPPTKPECLTDIFV